MANLEQLTEDVEETKVGNHSRNYVVHVWLEGFRKLMGDVNLLKFESDSYLRDKLEEASYFTILISSNYHVEYKKQMDRGELQIKQLPINEQYHLQFPLLFNKGNYSFMLTPCTICNGDKEHKLPLIELRKSINLSNSILNKNVIMYDNRVSPSSISWDTIKRAYITIHDFIESCRINEDYRNIMQKNPSLS